MRLSGYLHARNDGPGRRRWHGCPSLSREVGRYAQMAGREVDADEEDKYTLIMLWKKELKNEIRLGLLSAHK